MVQNKAEAEPKRRGRPRTYDPVEALRRATEAFWKSGFAGTSLDEISAATGMNRPSLNAAFGDKHALYLKALTDYWTIKFAKMREALGARSIRDALMNAYEAALSIYFPDGEQARGCFVVGTAITEALDDPEIRSIIAEGFRTLDAHFEARLRVAREAGELRDGADPEVLAVLASAAMQSIAIRARSGATRDELTALARKVVAEICG